MDIIFVNQIDFSEADVKPQIGQLILYNLVKKKYEAEWINFDLLNMEKESKFKYVQDMEKNIESIIHYILSKNPKIVGFYCICNSFEIVIEVACKLKLINPNLHIILGGPHASVLAEDILADYDFIDLICIGESEKIILPIMDLIINKKDKLEFGKIPSICYRDNNNLIIKNCNVTLLTDKELTKYSVSVPTKYKNKVPFIDIEGGRGCPFQCTFCSTNLFWRREHRLKPITDLINEIIMYREIHGIDKFYIVHDHFTANPKHVYEFCKTIIDERYDFKWSCSSRVDILDETLLDYMKKANCVEIYLGIETGSKKMQKDIKKNIDLDKAVQTIKYMMEIGIKDITTSFIFGFPNETISDFRDTISLMEEILLMGIVSVQLHRLMLFVGSEELNKVLKSDIYFDINNMRMGRMEKRFFSEYGLQLIKSKPKYFYQYYTFNSEVYNEYKYFDDFLSMLTTAMIFYKKSIQFVIKKYSLEKLYQYLKEDIIKIHELSVENYTVYSPVTDYEKKCGEDYIEFMSEYIQKILLVNDIEEFDYLRYIYQFEQHYALFAKNISIETQILEYDFDVFYAIRNESLIRKKTFVRLSRKGCKISLEKIDDNSFNLIKLFEKDSILQQEIM